MDILDPSLENSEDKDGEGSDGCLTDTKDIIAAQGLTIVEEDGSLGSGEDQAAVAELAHTQGLLDGSEEDVQYQFRSTEGGTVTYRVVQVGSGGDSVDSMPQIVSPSSFSTTTGSVQAVLTTTPNGQFYVLGSPPEIFSSSQSARSLAPRSAIQLETSRGPASRDDRRRATHNEVERRRRDKINNWIMKLSMIIPDCSGDSAKAGQQSKGGILAKACDYIMELRTSNQKLADALKDNEKLKNMIEILRQQNNDLKHDNNILRATLSQHGIADINGSVS